MKSKREMKEAMDRGKVLEHIKEGYKAYLDYDAKMSSPYVFEYPSGEIDSLKDSWNNYKDFEIMEKPKQITDPYRLKARIAKMLNDGILFYVRVYNGEWQLPYQFIYNGNVKDFKWIGFDPETGIPIGEPKEFTE